MKKVKSTITKYMAYDGTLFEDEEKCKLYDSGLTNLQTETIEILKEHNLLDDVKCVNYGKYFTTLDDFLDTSKDIWYDSGYGCPEIYQYIQIIGNNWWIERREYDGSEWWELVRMPEPNQEYKKITKKEII